MSIFGGAVCGALGVYGLQGIAFFIVLSLMQSQFILVACKFSPSNYFVAPTNSVLFLSATDRDIILSFLLFWTLFYGMVHVF